MDTLLTVMSFIFFMHFAQSIKSCIEAKIAISMAVAAYKCVIQGGKESKPSISDYQ